MTAIMGTMSEPVRGRVRSRFSIGLAGILVFRGLLVIRLGLATARLVIRLRFPKLQTVQCRVKERGGIGDKTVLFAAERGVVEFGRIIIHGLISWDGQFGELIVHLGVESSVEVHDH